MSDSDSKATIEYGRLMHDAMRGLIRKLLERVARDGLPGDHHFFISFDTNHPGVELAPWLHDRYPEDMTIVLQHWYDNLDVREDGFTVTLNFGDSQEPMVVPWAAMKTFADPSVGFGFQFKPEDAESDDEDAPAPFAELDEEPEPPRRDAEVVSLDKFRK